jgi:hypothetical protein
LSGEEILVPAKEYLHSVKLDYEDKRKDVSSLMSDYRNEEMEARVKIGHKNIPR